MVLGAGMLRDRKQWAGVTLRVRARLLEAGRRAERGDQRAIWAIQTPWNENTRMRTGAAVDG